ncbi:MAG: hypothetical protein BZY79_05035 [SAR202 cluster bacterium Casp-Chloro-G4]|nr:hypothetical protein [Chloroflexota bacterium]PKB61193.1 MAG: hypothetical protein BZY79_05035 [SAR202 cluster bacterium Casp-Chloro-G4]
MLRNSLIRNSLVWSAVLMAAILLAACGGGAGPQARQFDLDIEHGAVELESGVISVTQGDQVTLNFSADEDGMVHLHGYDIELEVGPEEPTSFEFAADATGRYNFTFHEGGGDHHDADMDMSADVHASTFESGILEEGDTFEFEVPLDMHEGSIPFHNHMTYDVTGHIMVDEGAVDTGTVSIRVKSDGSFSPMEVEVQPGTNVLWTNQGPDRARITSGNPPTAPDDDHDDDEEIVLGALEVRPR